jgi:hypothetical protein
MYNTYLTVKELRETEEAFVKYVQGQIFKAEIKYLETFEMVNLQEKRSIKKLLKRI